jgi:hypothetical protein
MSSRQTCGPFGRRGRQRGNGAESKVLDAIRHLPLENQAAVLRAAIVDTMRQLDPEGRRRFWWQLSEDAVYAERSLR